MSTLKTALNEQHIEAAWQQLLPDNCSISCGKINRGYPALTALERASFANELSNIRLTELEAGRYHAKNALRKLNIITTDLPKSKGTPAPQWPNKVKGSITHTGNTDHLSHVAAVVTTSAQIKHIGIDAEFFFDLRPDMWDKFISKDELDWIFTIKTELRTSLVKKTWCMKEAAVKAFSVGNIMAYSVCPDSNTDFTKFNLVNHHLKNTIIKGRVIETNGITLALAYA